MAQVESSEGRAKSGLGRFFVCLSFSLVRCRAWRRVGTHQVKPFFLQAIHNDFKRFVCDGVELVLLTLRVDRVQPLLICEGSVHQIQQMQETN
jgi:hypothetical protein